MEILLWLVPPVALTGLAMLWVSWWGREGRGAVDHEEAVARLGAALEAEPRTGFLNLLRRRAPRPLPGYAAPPAPRDRSSGVALRAQTSSAAAPSAATPAAGRPGEAPVLDDGVGEPRLAPEPTPAWVEARDGVPRHDPERFAS